ncbi:MAG: type II toxin-antitoxin system Phd/YefM family antitoxin [Ignavibacteriota bacterium]
MTHVTLEPSHTDVGNLLHLLKDSSDPVHITIADVNAIVVTEAEWNGLQETLYLESIPGMKESIAEGMNTPLDECSDKIEW